LVRLVLDAASGLRCTEVLGAQLQTGANPIFAFWKRDLVVFDKASMSAIVYEDGDSTQRFILQCHTSLVQCAGSGSVLFCPTRSSVAIHLKSDELQQLCYTRAPIVRLAINPPYRVFAVATADGTVAAYSVRTGDMVLGAQVNGEVAHLIITEKFAFILAIMNDAIALLSVDAELIKTVPVRIRMSKVYQFTSVSDFDYVAFETYDSKIGFFEAFYPENVVMLGDIEEPTVQITYTPILAAFLVLGESGKMKTIVQSIEINTERQPG
jgi:hypothetical protein